MTGVHYFHATCMGSGPAHPYTLEQTWPDLYGRNNGSKAEKEAYDFKAD
ncbi:MAG: hypothetical protein GY943_12060 [Chloroflexi bacterium]|nr:hypothetical protein [Chloroflexota bacterium]